MILDISKSQMKLKVPANVIFWEDVPSKHEKSSSRLLSPHVDVIFEEENYRDPPSAIGKELPYKTQDLGVFRYSPKAFSTHAGPRTPAAVFLGSGFTPKPFHRSRPENGSLL
ncbi:hypothetical protein TNCT_418001 [Trichonephila clavata]|uniref:Uncharacterized protein n=1 Tax=Trichonephila clavata TaxID=2740835 RepID=A0A8X6FLC5_TRICU|nr:hypothetical protein TNCT_418001 [Trichonephila clavata]